uniref:ABC transmembrane type-1 domain-containing protein n=2 Tax=Emiliania huxleyi TaxID=2903 RepID=A0A0D3JPF8_EMIH1
MCSLVTLAVAAVALRAGPIPALPRPVTLAADARVKHVAAVALHPLQPVVARPSGLSGLRCGRCGRPVLSAAPAKKVKTPWKTLLSLCKPDAAPLVTAFVCLAVAASGDALLPALQGAALNAALGLGTDAAGSLAQLRPALVRLAAVGLGTAVFTGIRGFCFWAFHDEQGPGDLSTRLATDCVKLGDVLSLNVNIVLRQVLQSLAGMAVVLRLSGRLALLVVAGAQQDRLAASSGVAEQCFSLIKLVRSHGSQRSERR